VPSTPTESVASICTAPSISTASKFVVPSTSKSVPTKSFLTMPTPPSVCNEPVVVELESVVVSMLKAAVPDSIKSSSD